MEEMPFYLEGRYYVWSLIVGFCIIVLFRLTQDKLWEKTKQLLISLFISEKFEIASEMKIFIKTDYTNIYYVGHDEKYRIQLMSDKISWENYFVKVKNGEELTVLPLDFVLYTKLYFLIKTKGSNRTLSCEKSLWKKKIKVINAN